MKQKGFLRYLTGLCRLVVAATFIFSGFVKAVDPVGTQIKITDYFSAFGIGSLLTSGDILLVACILAGVEFLLGVYLLFGSFRDGTLKMLLLILVIFTPLTLYLALENPVSDCGCFGDAVKLTNWQTFAKNVVLLALTIFLFAAGKNMKPLVSHRRSWLLTLVTVLLIGHFMLSNVRDLPVLDFRPYKIGTDLKQAVLESPDGRYDDFYLMTPHMADCTDSILSHDGYTFLLVAPHLEEASEENADILNDLYDYCVDAGYPMIGVTASGSLGVEKWCSSTGAEYTFLNADEIPLQTMVRSNPGVVVLKDGVIKYKWSHWDVPIDEISQCRMEQLSASVPWMSEHTLLWLLCYFILPYLLLIGIDRLACSIKKN